MIPLFQSPFWLAHFSSPSPRWDHRLRNWRRGRFLGVTRPCKKMAKLYMGIYGENGDIMRRSEGLLDLYIVERERYIYSYISILKLHEEHNLQMRLRNVNKMSMNSYQLFIFLGVRGSKGPNIANIHMLVLFPEDRSPLCHRAATWSLIWPRESARVETWPLTGCVLLLDDHEVSWISHGFPMDFPDIHGFYAVS